MTTSKIAVFMTSDIKSAWNDPSRATPGERKIGVFNGGDGEVVHVYTLDQLESALAQGYDVWVVSTRTGTCDHDEWWLALVKRDQVLLDTDYKGFGVRDEHLIKPWRTLYERIGLVWGDFDTWTEARDALPKLGIKLGWDFAKPAAYAAVQTT